VLGVRAMRMNEIVKDRRAVTADTGVRLLTHFGGVAAAWLAMWVNHYARTLAMLATLGENSGADTGWRARRGVTCAVCDWQAGLTCFFRSLAALKSRQLLPQSFASAFTYERPHLAGSWFYLPPT
jgi:hypothetical protein